MSDEKNSITERIYRNLIVGDSIKRQALITGEINILSSLIILWPSCPFPKEMAYIAMASSIPYFFFYFFYEKIKEKYFNLITSTMSFMAFFLLFFVTHMSGGITSPFIFLYFCVLVLENIGGIRGRFSLFFAILSYTAVVIGEFSGLLLIKNEAAKAIYASNVTTFVLYIATVSFMATVSYSVQLIYENIKLKMSREAKEREELIIKYSQIEKKSNLGMLTHRIVHDMRTPLTTIKNYIIMARKSDEIRNDEKRFAIIQSYIDNLSKTMDALVSYGRKGFDYATRSTEICSVIDNSISVLKFYTSNVDYDVNFSIPRDTKVHFNVNELYTVIFNLLKNAIDALEGSKVSNKRIEINCRQEESFVFLSIYNNGPVVEADKIAIAFKESFTTKKEGSGLGLMIAADLCSQNDAEIKMENKGEEYGVLVEIKTKKIDS